MKFRPSTLNIFALLFLAGCIVFTVVNYTQLSEGEGWGVVGMVGLLGFGVVLLIADMVIQNVFRNRITANIIGLVIAIAATLLILGSGFFA